MLLLLAVALVQVELGQLQVAGLRNLQINLRTVDDGYGNSGALNDGSFIGTYEAVVGSLGKGAFEQGVAEALGCLRQHDVLTRDGGGDEGAVSGALHLLDGVDGGHADDGGSQFSDGVNCAVDGGDVDQRSDGVVDQDDVVRLGGQSGEGVGDRFLAILATFDDLDFAGEAVLGDLRFDALDLRGADGDVDGGDALDCGESAKGVDEDGYAIERKKLLGLRAGHARAETGCWKNYKYLHNVWSIQR